MSLFYTSAVDQIDHIEGIARVKAAVTNLKDAKERPEAMLSRPTDIFGGYLAASDTLEKLRQPPMAIHMCIFEEMMKRCLQAIIDVLERQYNKYFEGDISEKLREETKSTRCHNIDAEEVMGMFSAAQQRAPHATLCYLLQNES